MLKLFNRPHGAVLRDGQWVLPLVLLIISAVVAWGRRDHIAQLLRRKAVP